MPDELNPVSRDIYTVSRLNREVRTVLETGFPLLWLEGELSNFSRPSSGHWYFTLKDEAAQVKCAMFRNRNLLAQITPENGKQVLVRARIGLYEARGDYQIIIEHMEEAGDGALRRQFDLLKKKLADEGLFDSAHKKSIPDSISRVGIITSATGAAIHDILTTLQRRSPMQSIIIYPVPVQGKGASDKIARAIKKANKRNEVDVLILARGGGSLEDLWEFNEEKVARAVHASSIPIVTGVGHEVDFTIADFVADFRAATPTAAAELISPDCYQQLQKIATIRSRLVYLLQQKLQQKQQQVDWLSKRIRHPKERIFHLQSQLQRLEQRNIHAIESVVMTYQSKVKLLDTKIQKYEPSQRLQQEKLRYNSVAKRFHLSTTQLMAQKSLKLQHLVQTLDALSPLHTLKRGYAIIKDQNEKIIRTTSAIQTGQTIKTEIAKGHFFSTITEIKND
jgi:exodeoxyribonuclease VII large subunit